MPRCAACNTTILFGGVKRGPDRFCNAGCAARGNGDLLALTARDIPDDLVAHKADELRRGPCRICRSTTAGPLDLHRWHFVQSLVVVTRWGSKTQLCCRACARKKQLASLLSTAALGWWGIPWGLVWTPIQIGRNISGLMKPPRTDEPSTEILALSRKVLAQEILAEAQAGAAPADPDGPPATV